MLFKLINLQSHVNTVIQLVSGSMNIIRADSETGKSVSMKLFKFLCKGSAILGADCRRVLIRRGCEFGEYIIEDEGNIFGVRLFKTYEVYFWNAEEFLQDHPPKIILDYLGICMSGDILLNVIDKHSVRALLDEDIVKNGEFLRRMLSSNLMSTFKEKLIVKSEDLNELKKQAKTKIKVLENQNSRVQYTDISKPKMYLEELKEIKKKYVAYEDASKLLEEFRKGYVYYNVDIEELYLLKDKYSNNLLLEEILNNFKKSYIYGVNKDLLELSRHGEEIKLLFDKMSEKAILKLRLEEFKNKFIYGVNYAIKDTNVKLSKFDYCPYCNNSLKDKNLSSNLLETAIGKLDEEERREVI